MTEKEPSVVSVAFKYGFIFALVGVIYSLILMVSDLGDNRWLSSLAYLILIAGIVVAMKSYREDNHGYMSYGQGLGIGTIVAAVFGFLSGLFTWLYTEFVDTEYMARMMEKQRVQMLEQGLSDEQIDAGMAMAENFQGPLTMILGATFVTLIIGFILSLVISGIMKNSRPEFE
ncbi:uncharacterized protein DUF4199 [Pontibacter ummariensis]|uniref:DUF4199 domain-containing protein n=1 Tax=Pontibacter ummariensis TaxID=1610492 RepID=A0A239F1W6_9BACT|nr:DUF4199 domain-containing protein [Pontibacter ummariensis]PRY12634.1 uncharacterized protein DUF4199 [Pontibacter ummariensis]SNS50817.1 Protein of unknown function [Pontibacter ummariensis]